MLQISDVEVPGGSDEADSLVQIVISREGRMAGVGFKAQLIDAEWFPDVVTTWQAGARPQHAPRPPPHLFPPTFPLTSSRHLAAGDLVAALRFLLVRTTPRT